MKHRGITLTILLLSLCLLLGGCGKSDNDKLVGTWESNVDLSALINEEFAEDPELAEYFQVDGFGLTLLFTFGEDGSYQISADEDAFSDACDNMITSLAEGAKKYLEDMAMEEGLEMDADAMLGLLGFSMDEFIEELMAEEDLTSLLDEIEDSGKFEAKDGKLYTTLDESDYIAYEFVSDTELRFTEFGGEDASDEELELMLPLTLTKQS